MIVTKRLRPNGFAAVGHESKTKAGLRRRTATAFVVRAGMNAREILDPLRQNERASPERGVTHAVLFGCAARGEPRSDIDITVEIAPDVRVGVIAYVGIVQFIEDMFPTGGATTRRCFSIREQGATYSGERSIWNFPMLRATRKNPNGKPPTDATRARRQLRFE
jgi:uncharacterized protein